MTQFAIFAIALIVGAIAIVLRPLLLARPAKDEAIDRKAANLGIFRDQLAELEREKADGSLADADFEQARAELQRRLLEEVDGTAVGGGDPAHAPSRKTAIALIVLLPLLSLGAYGLLGNPRALDPAQVAERPQLTPEQIEGMVAKLAERMQKNPEDMQGWVMLGRSYKALGRDAEAAQAFAHAEAAISDNPDLLAVYAETLATANGRQLAGKPRQLVDRALQINPNHAHALFLAGAAAMEAGENAKAAGYWEALLPQVEPGSDVEQMLRAGIEKARQGK